jgi:agmatine deiminase
MSEVLRRMPAEWEPHRATWLVWPSNREDWPHRFDAVPFAYLDIVRALATGEVVEVLCYSEEIRARAQHILNLAGLPEVKGSEPSTGYRFHTVQTDRGWIRDSGATAIYEDHKLNWIKWTFNAWALYDDHKLDARVPSYMSRINGAPIIPALRPGTDQPFIMEGGAFDVDGQGTLITTEQCLLSVNQQVRNAGFSRKDYEDQFREYLGIEKVIWLGQGCAGLDDTNGHIDDVARFVAPGKVVLGVEDDPNDIAYGSSRDNLMRLRSATDALGRSLEVIELPIPTPLYWDGQRMAASYANFYIGNRTVLVPTFNDPNDCRALSILSDVFPDRDVVGIFCGDIIEGCGSIHCLTQQEPVGTDRVGTR